MATLFSLGLATSRSSGRNFLANTRREERRGWQHCSASVWPPPGAPEETSWQTQGEKNEEDGNIVQPRSGHLQELRKKLLGKHKERRTKRMATLFSLGLATSRSSGRNFL